MAEGDVVAVVESMKMETSLTAPFAGRVRRVLTGTNVQVPAHTPLLQLEAIEDEAAEQSAERVDFAADAARATSAVRAPRSIACAGCCSATTSPATRSAARSPTLRDGNGGAELIAGEHRLLDVFTDVRALSRARHDPERELLHSPQEYLHAFLRSLDAKAERLPERFVSAARARALALRRRQPRPHARARGGVLPPVRLPGPRRPRARRGDGDPRAAPRAAPTSSSAPSATSSAACSTGSSWPPSAATR